MTHRILAAIAGLTTLALTLAGCVNGFEKYYKAAPGADQIARSPFVIAPPARPVVYSYSSDPKADVHKLVQEGYLYLGMASFYANANKVSETQAIEQGKKVGAAVILIHSQYMDTVSGSVPYTVQNAPVVSTVNTTGSVNTYGSGGYANGTYNANSTITTPGGTSTYAIPYSFNRNNYVATYWARRATDKILLGVNPLPLPDDVRQRLQRNTGVVIGAVIRGTPAFQANFLEGDVMLKIGDEDLTDAQSFSAQVAKYAGRTVDIQILRNDQPKTISVTLRPSPSP